MLASILLVIFSVLFILYAIIIYLYRVWFLRLQLFTLNKLREPLTKFTIIIPARDEEKNIEACLVSVLNQQYPAGLFEVIVIDDHSLDQTPYIVQSLQNKYANLKLLSLANELNGEVLNAYKKKAIEKAIEQSTGNWIVTTDADCMVKSTWLLYYDAYIQDTNAVFIAAPVLFNKKASILSMLQYIDFIGMQAITAAAVSAGFHSMCNGANLAYRKDVFYEVNGFKGIDNIASGDDMLLMNKIKEKHPRGIGYLFSREAIVTTDPMPDWKSFFNQRIRWASKSDQYKDKNVFWVLVLVYLLNAMLLIAGLLSFVNIKIAVIFFFAIAIKTLIELLFIVPAQYFFGEKFLLWFPVLQPFHILYIVIAGWLGKFGKYQWKGRVVK